MDSNDPPPLRSGAAKGRDFDGVDEKRPRRFPRLLDPPSVPRLSPTRLALAGLLGLAVVAALVYFGQLSWARSIRWLHQQPIYSVEFSEIELDPPPPPWIRGGREGFLKRFSKEGNRELFSALDLDLNKLGLKFRADPLVKRVDRIEVRWPNRIVVRLEYRLPVALSVFNEKPKERVAIDDEGVLISVADLEMEKLLPPTLQGDPTPLIWFKGLDPPVNPALGRPWFKRASPIASESQPEPTTEEPRAAIAGELAAFLRGKVAQEKELRHDLEHLVIHLPGRGEVFLQCGRLKNSPMIRWSVPSGRSDPRSFTEKLTEAEKWQQLRAWLLKNRKPPEGPSLDLDFSTNGLVPRQNEASSAPSAN